MIRKWYYGTNKGKNACYFGRCTEEEGARITDIIARVWRLDDGQWAYACPSNIIISPELYNITGKEPSRLLAIKKVEEKILPHLLLTGDDFQDE